MFAPTRAGSRHATGASIVYERTRGRASAPLALWERRQPEKTTLWNIVADALPHFVRTVEEATGRGLPPHIDRELRRYLDCGLLENGFARVKCHDCKSEILVAFSCKGRGLCPSCTTRRMHDTAAHLVDRVIPFVPIRQYVITFPRRVRYHLARDPKLAAQVLALCLRVIFGWQRRHARNHGVVFGAPGRSQNARCGAIAFIQRFDSSLALDWHIHALVCDGVFSRNHQHDPDARPHFHAISSPTDDDVASMLATLVARVVDHLRRRGRLDDDTDDDPDDTGAQIARNAARPLASSSSEIPPPPPLCARLEGFSLHAARTVHQNDRQGLEQLAR